MSIQNAGHDMDDAAGLFKALGHKGRLKVFCALYDGEKNVSELTKIADLGQSALSQHLALLRKLGLVKTRRDAQTIYYSIACDKAKQILRCAVGLYGPCDNETCSVEKFAPQEAP